MCTSVSKNVEGRIYRLKLICTYRLIGLIWPNWTKTVEALHFFLIRLISTRATPTEKKEIGRQIVKCMKLAHVTEPTDRAGKSVRIN